MADLADIATDNLEVHMNAKLTALRQRQDYTHVTECQECGDTIGTARKLAHPNARYCIDCQEELEGVRKWNQR